MEKVYDQSGKEYSVIELSEMLNTKSVVEHQRYKQDCRKRALEMAHSELEQLMKQDKGADFITTEVADKYYQWLITIPQ